MRLLRLTAPRSDKATIATVMNKTPRPAGIEFLLLAVKDRFTLVQVFAETRSATKQSVDTYLAAIKRSLDSLGTRIQWEDTSGNYSSRG